MVNFRFHLVSLTAVFLALAAGITIGAGVVDRATVGQIERQLRDVDTRREATNAENDKLRTDLSRWGAFSEQLGDRPVEARLAGATVVVVGTTGIDRGLVEGLRDAMVGAGAQVDGLVWFTGKWRLGTDEDARQLARIVGVEPGRAVDVRATGLAKLAASWAAGDGGTVVSALLDAGFLEFAAPPEPAVALSELPRAGSLFVLVSGDDADVPPAELAQPLASHLAASGVPLLAAQPVRPPAPTESGKEPPPPEFVMALRADGALAGRISTVDNVDDYRGRVALALALQEMAGGRRGHYGFGPDTRLVPEPRRQ